MRASPEPKKLEHLSDASFLGKLLVLPANVRLGWKEIARYKYYNLFGLNISNEGKKFYNIDTSQQFYKTFFSLSLTKRHNKLRNFSMSSLSYIV
jgi:hypothetical protein